MIRHATTKRAKEMRLYRTKLKPAFLLTHTICFRCNKWISPVDSTIHHFFGRTGALLCWVPGFRMACMPCHNWIETHRNDSVRLGLRAPDSLFNRPSLVIPK